MQTNDASADSQYQEIRDLLAQVALRNEETAKLQQGNAHQLKELEKQTRELGRQIGGLGEKFGGFTEGLALPSMSKILRERFRTTFVAPRARAYRNGQAMEVDVLAYSNSGTNEVYVVEVKSHLREESIQQILKTLREFRSFFPEHRDKKLFGILAAVDAPPELQKKVLQEGIYLANIHDGVFEIQVPDDFQPRTF
ncbi:MAG TPA: DUF3782 domain-containing protein [Thermoanaerobaculia bacterium]|jgi:hypothetical protein|nr:DUF3782 domain-containing protein [Thermoanaerobaculia bacterium]